MAKLLFPIRILILLNFTQCLCFQIHSSGLRRGFNPDLVEAFSSSSLVGNTKKDGGVLLVTRMMGKNEEEATDNGSEKILGVFKKNPGTIIAVPFVVLVGVDLIANIAVVTKRSLEGMKLLCWLKCISVDCGAFVSLLDPLICPNVGVAFIIS
ncbi:hypothetical protein ACHAW6_014388 [Cyclotella cf. meneghiniana]